MKDSVLSLSQQLRDSVQPRWLSALSASRCLTVELSSVEILGVDLTPHGFSIEFLYDNEFDPSWLPLIERHAAQLAGIKQVHCMMAANAGQWMRSQGRDRESQTLISRGKEEVMILEWEDGRVDWLPGFQGELRTDSEELEPWSLTGLSQTPDEENPRLWRIVLEGVTASSIDRLRKLQKLNKKFSSIFDELTAFEGSLLGAAPLKVQELWRDWDEKKVALALVTPGVKRAEGVEELAEAWALDAASSSSIRPGSEQPLLGAIGCWEGANGDVWGDLRWQAAASTSLDVMTDWLHSVQRRLKLLGFECEIVAHLHPVAPAKAGDAAFREAAQWLKRWAKHQGLEVAASVGYDTEHGSESWGGPSLEWRVFDPLGASWPLARLGVGVEVRAAWVKHWRRHFNRQAQRHAALVEQRAARLQDGQWLMAASSVDVEQEARLTQIWQSWNAKSGGSR